MCHWLLKMFCTNGIDYGISLVPGARKVVTSEKSKSHKLCLFMTIELILSQLKIAHGPPSLLIKVRGWVGLLHIVFFSVTYRTPGLHYSFSAAKTIFICFFFQNGGIVHVRIRIIRFFFVEHKLSKKNMKYENNQFMFII